MSYKSRQESDAIARDCFFQADTDRSNTITIYEFYNFLQLVFQRLGIFRQVSQPQCQQLFRFYDDDRNGFLTPNELVDIVWDLYTADIQNDRVAIQQMLEKIVIEKYYHRPYNQFDQSNLYGHWGQTNTKGDWRNYRFNPYQMHKMQKFGYEFKRPVNNFQNIGMSSDFSQGGFGGNQQSSLGNFGQQSQGMYGGNTGGSGFGGQMQMGGMQNGQMTYGSGVVQTGGVIDMTGRSQMGMGGGMGMGMGMGQQGMGMNMNMGMGGGMGMNMGMGQQGMGMGGMGMNQGMGMGMGQQGMGMGGMGMNQGMGMGQQGGYPRTFHTVNQSSPYGQQQMLMDPFSWNQIPSFNTDPQYIVLPSPTQLNQNERMIDLNTFGQMTQYIQVNDIALVTPIRSRQLTQYQCFEAVKQLPYMLQSQGYNGPIHFKIYFAEFVNLLEQNKFKW